MKQQFRLSKEEFDFIYSKVPRLSVEVLLKDPKKGVFLTKRSLEPCKGQWHLPGGTVYFGESLKDAVRRVAERELDIVVINSKQNGYIEYPSHYLNDLDSPVGLVFEVTGYTGTLKPNKEALDSGWFTRLPSPMHADQDRYLLNNGYID